MSIGVKVPVRSATKPIYLIVVEDPQAKDGIAYYKSQDLMEGSNYVELRGFILTKLQADKLIQDPHAKVIAKTEPKAVNRKIPWLRVIRIENATYQKPQGENNNEQ